MRFGKTKGEIRVKKGDFRGDLFFFRGLDHVWESPHTPTFGKTFPNVFFWGPSLFNSRSEKEVQFQKKMQKSVIMKMQ